MLDVKCQKLGKLNYQQGTRTPQRGPGRLGISPWRKTASEASARNRGFLGSEATGSRPKAGVPPWAQMKCQMLDVKCQKLGKLNYQQGTRTPQRGPGRLGISPWRKTASEASARNRGFLGSEATGSRPKAGVPPWASGKRKAKSEKCKI